MRAATIRPGIPHRPAPHHREALIRLGEGISYAINSRLRLVMRSHHAGQRPMSQRPFRRWQRAYDLVRTTQCSRAKRSLMPWICCWRLGRRQFQPPVDRPKLEYELHTPGITIVQEADVVVNYINRNPDKRGCVGSSRNG